MAKARKSGNMDKTKLTFVCFKEGNTWVAQCLEYDIVGTGDEIGDACYELECSIITRLFYAQKNNLNPFIGVPKAPKKHWEKLNSEGKIELVIEKAKRFKLPHAPASKSRTRVKAPDYRAYVV